MPQTRAVSCSRWLGSTLATAALFHSADAPPICARGRGRTTSGGARRAPPNRAAAVPQGLVGQWTVARLMTEGAVANRKRRPDRGSAARERRGPRRRRTPPTARSRPPHPNRPLETWQRTEANRSEVPKALRADRERVEKRMEEPRTQDGELFLLVLPNGSALSCGQQRLRGRPSTQVSTPEATKPQLKRAVGRQLQRLVRQQATRAATLRDQKTPRCTHQVRRPPRSCIEFCSGASSPRVANGHGHRTRRK